MNLNLFKDKKILITGHTGFKGSWLLLSLQKLGGKILGISKDVTTEPAHFDIIKKNFKTKFFDIQNYHKLNKAINGFKPDYIFHLAAQSLVKKSYKKPFETWKTNLNGTLNILEVLKNYKKKVIVVLITSDKSYKNIEKRIGYKETDEIGGIDPYSASKSATEIAINSYFNSHLKLKKNLSIVTARAGNVIGGGDWSDDRLIPDCVRSWSKKKTITIRNPNSTRPWQHVLEAVWGYIILSIFLKKNKKKFNGEVFNIGPNHRKNYRVIDCLKIFQKYWPNVKWRIKKDKTTKETNLLKLNCSKMKIYTGWETILDINQTIKLTADWYKNFYKKKNNLSYEQINSYYSKLKSKLKI